MEMPNQEPRSAFVENQNILTSTCFLLASGAIVFLITQIRQSELSFSMIPISISILVNFISILSGIRFLKARGNYLSAASNATKETPVNILDFEVSRHFKRQVKYLIFAGLFLLVWVFWDPAIEIFGTLFK